MARTRKAKAVAAIQTAIDVLVDAPAVVEVVAPKLYPLPSTSFVVIVEGQHRVACKYRGQRVLLKAPFVSYAHAKCAVAKINTVRQINPALWSKG